MDFVVKLLFVVNDGWSDVCDCFVVWMKCGVVYVKWLKDMLCILCIKFYFIDMLDDFV